LDTSVKVEEVKSEDATKTAAQSKSVVEEKPQALDETSKSEENQRQ
jgi:hypothetical protein